MQPRFEPIGVSQRPKLLPRPDKRGLHGILSKVGVAQDPGRDRHATIADQTGQGVEGFLVTPPRPVHELSLHEGSSPRGRSVDPDHKNDGA